MGGLITNGIISHSRLRNIHMFTALFVLFLLFIPAGAIAVGLSTVEAGKCTYVSGFLRATSLPHSIHKPEAGSPKKNIYLQEATFCIVLKALKTVEPFEVYFHIPVMVEGQRPIALNLWTRPACRATSYRVLSNYSGINQVMEVSIRGLNANETVRLMWESYTLVEPNNYMDMPRSIEKTSEEALPKDVRPWLAATDFIQANHPDIQALAERLVKSETNVVEIADRIANFTANEIEYKGGGAQDALTTLQMGYAVCTGKADLAAALLRASGIPARVLLVLPITHYIVEYYAHPYGWIRLESTMGINPNPNQRNLVNFRAHPEDETSSSIINGQHPYHGVIAYWGTSDADVYWKVDSPRWKSTKCSLLSDARLVDEVYNITEKAWGHYTSYLGSNLTAAQGECFKRAVEHQKTAVICFEEEQDLNGCMENLLSACTEYSRIAGSGEESSGTQEEMNPIGECVREGRGSAGILVVVAVGGAVVVLGLGVGLTLISKMRRKASP